MSEPMSDTGSRQRGDGLRFSPWNLMLLLPFLTLVTPWWNSIEPRLFGMPFFYWYQFAFVFVGRRVRGGRVRHDPATSRSPGRGSPLDVDEPTSTASRGGAPMIHWVELSVSRCCSSSSP